MICDKCNSRMVKYGKAMRRDGKHQRYRCMKCGRIMRDEETID